jgi:cytochrome c-type biogenesis protein CcmH
MRRTLSTRAPCHPERSEGPLRPRERSLAALGMTVVLLVLSCPSFAVEPSEMLKDPALEARARTISRELRCVVCQNQSIDDSAAEVAHDMRIAVRERLTAGDSDTAVRDYMVARYGDYVLLQPPFKPRTLVLWLGAPLVLLIAGAALLFAARRRPTVPAPVPLSDEEQAKLDSLLGARHSSGAQAHDHDAPLEWRAPSK